MTEKDFLKKRLNKLKIGSIWLTKRQREMRLTIELFTDITDMLTLSRWTAHDTH